MVAVAVGAVDAAVAEVVAEAAETNPGGAKEIPTGGGTKVLAATMILANNGAGTIEPSVAKASTR